MMSPEERLVRKCKQTILEIKFDGNETEIASTKTWISLLQELEDLAKGVRELVASHTGCVD